MTDTPTPPAMTPEQRAELVTHYTRGKWYIWNGGADCPVPLGTRLEIVGGFDDNWTTVAEEGSIFWPNVAAFRIDRPTSKLTAERDAAQAEIARLAKINVKLCADFNLMNQHGARQDTEIARLTMALATAREDGMREAADMAHYLMSTTDEPVAHDRLGASIDAFTGPNLDAQNDWLRNEMLARITKGAAT